MLVFFVSYKKRIKVIQMKNLYKRDSIKWFLYTLVSWYLSIIVSIVLSYAIVNKFHPEETNMLLGFGADLCIGLVQWLLLRKSHSVSFYWLLAHAFGIGIPFEIGVLGMEGDYDYSSIASSEF